MSYRSTYEKAIHKKIPKGYEIHHIDMNRNHNYIDNLVMLPKKLHQDYHRTLEHLTHFNSIEVKMKSVVESGNGTNEAMLEAITEFVNVWSECNKWVDYKYYMLGLIPNIHNVEVNYDGTKKNV